ncbi:MAG: Rpn family recombination-promoting nuclease/putative transposase, partial [Minicystis sp.]
MQPSVHDSFFKAMFSQAEHAASLLRQVLPPPLAARIDFASLTLCAGSFVDEALKERHSDLLFSASADGHPALLYVLFEHQSVADPKMPFRLLRYMVRIWDDWLEDHPDAAKLPLILPVVLHHSERGWTGSTSFEDLLDATPETLAAARDHLPGFRFVLEDISHQSDEALRSRAMTALVRLALWSLRHSREPEERVTRAGAWRALVEDVHRAPGGAAAVVLVMRYIFTISDTRRPEELIVQLQAALGNEIKEEIVTAAEQLIERGRQQGMEKGLEKGMEKGLEKGLEK